MCRSKSAFCVIFLAVLAGAKYEANATELDKNPLTAKFDLLGKRLSLKLPSDSIKDARAHNIMSAEESDEDESRVELKLQDRKLILMANDLHSFSGPDLRASVNAFLKFDSGNMFNTSEILKSDGGLKYVLLQRKNKKINPKDEVNLIESAIVLSNDDTVQRLDIYTDKKGIKKQWDETVLLAENIFKSVETGTASPTYQKRMVTIDDFLGISILIPEKTAISTQHGCDFKVFHCQPMKDLSEPPASLGVYIGNHPDLSEKPGAASRKSKIVEQNIQWYKSKTDSKFQRSETIVQLRDFPDYYLHIFASAQTDDELNQLEKIAETLSLDKNSKANQPCHKGQLLLMNQMPAKALVQFKEAIRINSKDVQAYVGAAQAYLDLKDNQAAIETYTKALNIETIPYLLTQRAWLYKEAKEFQKSLADFSKYLEFYPDNTELLLERAKIYRELGEFQNAIDDCTKAIQIHVSKELLEERAINYERIGKVDLAKKDRSKAANLRTN